MQKKFFPGAVVKNFKLNDEKTIQLGITDTSAGTTIHVVGINVSDVEIITTEDDLILENANGWVTYRLKTEDPLLKGLVLLYDCGWDVDWDDSVSFTDAVMKFVPHSGNSMQKAVGWVWLEDADFIAKEFEEEDGIPEWIDGRDALIGLGSVKVEQAYEGRKCTFNPKDLKTDLVQEIGEKLTAYYYQPCVIESVDVLVGIEFENNYYSVKFEDGFTLNGISGYHLDEAEGM